MSTSIQKGLLQHAVRYATPRVRQSLSQLLATTLCFCGGWWLSWWALEVSWALSFLAAMLTGVFVLRLFIIQHDCGHGSFFDSRWANDSLGLVLGVITLAPYHYWRRTHAIHHSATSRLDTRNDPGYLLLWTVDEYLSASPGKRLAYRLYRNVWLLALLGVPFQYFFKHRYPWDVPKTWRREWWSVAFTNCALVAAGALAWWTIGLQSFLLVHVPVALTACALGGLLFYVQHNFEGCHWAEGEDWNYVDAALRGSSWLQLPNWAHWLTGHIGLHHVHHLCPRIPNYRLADCLDDSKELSRVRGFSLAEALGSAQLCLWDPRLSRLVAVPSIDATNPVSMNDDALTVPELPEGRSWNDFHRDVVQRFLSEGLFIRSPWPFALRSLIASAAICGGHLWLLNSPAWFPRLVVWALIAFGMVQAGMIGHDVGHNQLTTNRIWRRVVGEYHWTFLLGHCYRQWLDSHERHHLHTAESESDPDLRLPWIAFSFEQARAKQHSARFTAPLQHLLIGPMLLLHSFVLRIRTLTHVLAPKSSWLERGVVASSWFVWFGIPCVLLGSAAVTNFFGIGLLASVYMAASFLWNHIGTATVSSGQRVPFAAQRLLCTRHLGSGALSTFLLGGLNCHAEHHLAPTLPTHNLPRARRILRTVCERYGLAFREQGYVEALRSVYCHLRSVARYSIRQHPAASPPDLLDEPARLFGDR